MVPRLSKKTLFYKSLDLSIVFDPKNVTVMDSFEENPLKCDFKS